MTFSFLEVIILDPGPVGVARIDGPHHCESKWSACYSRRSLLSWRIRATCSRRWCHCPSCPLYIYLAKHQINEFYSGSILLALANKATSPQKLRIIWKELHKKEIFWAPNSWLLFLVGYRKKSWLEAILGTSFSHPMGLLYMFDMWDKQAAAAKFISWRSKKRKENWKS